MTDARTVTLYNNVKVPVFGLGTSHAGGYNHDAVVYALKECKYRLLDTAKRYGNESLIGQAIEDSKVLSDEIFIVDKLWPADFGFIKTLKAFQQSLENLRIHAIGLYLLHWPICPSSYSNPRHLRLETWRALEQLYDNGKCKAIGASNFMEKELEELIEDCSIAPMVNQIEFHPLCSQNELINFCRDNKIQPMGYSPLGKGALLHHPEVLKIASVTQCTPAQVLISWSIQNNVITIPKSTKLHRIHENAEALQIHLDQASMAILNSLNINYHFQDSSLIQQKIDAPASDGYKLLILN